MNRQPTKQDYRRRDCPVCGAKGSDQALLMQRLTGEPCRDGQGRERKHHHTERRWGDRA